jgi:hypothetical protein
MATRDEDMTDPKVLIVDMRGRPTFDVLVDEVLADVAAMLKRKNRAYGNSALEPVRIFSKADDIEQLKVRIDDKLSRIKNGAADGEDPEFDLLGYLVIKQIAHRLRAR